MRIPVDDLPDAYDEHGGRVAEPAKKTDWLGIILVVLLVIGTLAFCLRFGGEPPPYWSPSHHYGRASLIYTAL